MKLSRRNARRKWNAIHYRVETFATFGRFHGALPFVELHANQCLDRELHAQRIREIGPREFLTSKGFSGWGGQEYRLTTRAYRPLHRGRW